MTRKMHSVQEIVAALRRIKALTKHQPVKQAVQAAYITEVTYYRWRKRYEGLNDEQVGWLMRLQADNTRLCRLVANLRLDKRILEEVSKELLRNTVLRRQWVDHVRTTLKISERRVCKVLGQHRSTQRKAPKRPSRMLDPAPSLMPPRLVNGHQSDIKLAKQSQETGKSSQG